MTYDLLFPALGNNVLPLDHAYLLYSALSRVSPRFHGPANGVRCAAVTGERVGPGQLGLTRRSRLRIRSTDSAVPEVLRLAGKALQVGESVLRLGPPMVVPLTPAPSLRARIVTFKNCYKPDQLERFLATARDKLAELQVTGEPLIPLAQSGPRPGEPHRRVARVKGKKVIGYALIVTGLSAEESVRLQEQGLGGRTRMGCGFFLPVKERA